MNFAHESCVLVEKSVDTVCKEWGVSRNLPSLLTHVRAAEASDSEPDVARIVVVIEGRLVEVPIERTICEKGMVCWQSMDHHVPYLVSMQADLDRSGRTKVCVTVSYDPPGLLPDIVETLGGGATFAASLESDLRAYADAGRQPPP